MFIVFALNELWRSLVRATICIAYTQRLSRMACIASYVIQSHMWKYVCIYSYVNTSHHVLLPDPSEANAMQYLLLLRRNCRLIRAFARRHLIYILRKAALSVCFVMCMCKCMYMCKYPKNMCAGMTSWHLGGCGEVSGFCPSRRISHLFLWYYICVWENTLEKCLPTCCLHIYSFHCRPTIYVIQEFTCAEGYLTAYTYAYGIGHERNISFTGDVNLCMQSRNCFTQSCILEPV